MSVDVRDRMTAATTQHTTSGRQQDETRRDDIRVKCFAAGQRPTSTRHTGMTFSAVGQKRGGGVVLGSGGKEDRIVAEVASCNSAKLSRRRSKVIISSVNQPTSHPCLRSLSVVISCS